MRESKSKGNLCDELCVASCDMVEGSNHKRMCEFELLDLRIESS